MVLLNTDGIAKYTQYCKTQVVSENTDDIAKHRWYCQTQMVLQNTKWY